MDENDLSHLSYKELQALAHRYRVPGNIKKHILVRLLQAMQSGNELEVDRMLTEVQQTRKKRVKKQKLNMMNVSSTPIHSPNYTISDDCYYTRHQPPYQWVGAEEEIAIREEDTMRVPSYTEFQKFLLHRIQRDQYQAYNLNKNEVTVAPSIVDLRMGAGSSVLRPVASNNPKSSISIDPSSYARPASSQQVIELQMLEETGENNQGPLLLKKMLEAPAGANLGEIASPDVSSQRIWSIDQYPNNSGNPLDDSDTLTADSENDDVYENNNCNNSNNNNAENYYGTMNDNTKDQSYANNGADILSKNMDNIGQLRNNFPTEAIFPYPLGHEVSDIQANCEKWIAASSFVERNANYAEQASENSRSYNPVYYDQNNCGNSTITRPINRDRKYHQYNGTNEQNVNNEAYQTILHGQRFNWSNDPHQYYQQTVNAAVDATGNNPNELYYSQQMVKQPVAEINRECLAQGSNDMVPNSWHTVVQPPSPAQFAGNVYNKDTAGSFHHHHHHHHHENNNIMQYNSPYYSQYLHENIQHSAGIPAPVNPVQQQQQTSVMVQQETHYDRKNIAQPLTTQPVCANGVLDSFSPRWPINPTATSIGHLETVLNLHNRGNSFDCSKRNETSSVYCYTEPIVTQRIEGTHTWCTRYKPQIAGNRQHLFTPNVLVYNDASTGMIMANISESSSALENHFQEQLNEGPLNSSGDHDYELRASTDSSDSSINDVWIHDYASYPVSSDNALQSVDLTNDDNDDDLFSTVRDNSHNSIDDHTIETFTDMSY